MDDNELNRKIAESKYGGRYRVQSIAEKFWKFAEKADGCWKWNGALMNTGYGCIDVKNNPEIPVRILTAHRAAWMILRGPIPPDKHIDHLCRNRACVNPDHMELVSLSENVMRGVGPTALNAVKTECPRGHEYSSENTYTYKNKRYCRECLEVNRAKWKAKQKNQN